MVYASTKERWASALAAGTLVGAGLLALVAGLAGHPLIAPLAPSLEAIVPTRSHPSPPPSAEPTAQPRKQDDGGGGSPPPALHPAPHPDSAPAPAPPRIVLTTPVPLSPPGTGASSLAPGGGGNGTGTGTGSGNGSGAGSGSGGGYGSGAGYLRPAALPRQTKGSLHFSDLPADLRKSRTGNEMTLRYVIGTDGRASQCEVLRSSGRPDLDAQTCANIVERFRFRPARDEAGRAVAFVMTEIHGWANAPD